MECSIEWSSSAYRRMGSGFTNQGLLRDLLLANFSTRSEVSNTFLLYLSILSKSCSSSLLTKAVLTYRIFSKRTWGGQWLSPNRQHRFKPRTVWWITSKMKICSWEEKIGFELHNCCFRQMCFVSFFNNSRCHHGKWYKSKQQNYHQSLSM